MVLEMDFFFILHTIVHVNLFQNKGITTTICVYKWAVDDVFEEYTVCIVHLITFAAEFEFNNNSVKIQQKEKDEQCIPSLYF